jgi:carbon monoxide dehydrogenase subunit G
MGKVEVSHEMIVSAPVEEVFAYLTNADNFSEIGGGTEEIRGHSGPVSEGDTWQSVGKFMGREIKSDSRAVELKAPNVFRYESTSNAAETETRWEVRAVDDGTLIKHNGGGEVKGFFATLASSLLKSNVNKMYKSDMERLERRFNGEDV